MTIMGVTELEKQLEDLEKNMDSFIKDCAREITALLLRKTIQKTPVGQYPRSSGKKGGTLRKGWTGGVTESATNYSKHVQINQVGDEYFVYISNPVEYASYVEYGHTTTNGWWVDGQFMLKLSVKEVDNLTEKLVERKIRQYIKRYA